MMKLFKSLIFRKTFALKAANQKAALQKMMIAGSMAACLVMGQNCAQPSYSGIDEGGTPTIGLGAADPSPAGSQDSNQTGEQRPATGDQASINLPASGDGGQAPTNPPGASSDVPHSHTTAENPNSPDHPPGAPHDEDSNPPHEVAENPNTPPQDHPPQNTAENPPPPSEPPAHHPPEEPNAETGDHDHDVDVCTDLDKVEEEHRSRYVTQVDEKDGERDGHHEIDHDEHHEKRDHKHGHVAVMICHKGQTITVDVEGELNGHSKHGDYLGECGKPAVAACKIPNKEDGPKEEKHEARHEEHGKRVKHGEHFDEGGHCGQHAEKSEGGNEKDERGSHQRAETEGHERKGRS